MSDSAKDRARRHADSQELRELIQARIDEGEQWRREQHERRERRRRLLQRLIPLRRT
jgi:hypothetical protein